MGDFFSTFVKVKMMRQQKNEGAKDKAITALCVQRSLVWTSFFSGRGRNATLVSTLHSTIEIQRSTSCFRCIDLKFSPASSQAWDNSFHCRAFHFTLPWRFLLCTIFTLITLHCKGQRDYLDVFLFCWVVTHSAV